MRWEVGIFRIKLLYSNGMALKHNIPSVLCFPPQDEHFPFYVLCVGPAAKTVASQRVTEQRLLIGRAFADSGRIYVTAEDQLIEIGN